MLNLDTHILIHALAGDLEPHESQLLRRHRHARGISAIVLWEIAKLYEAGRINLSLEDPELVEVLKEVQVWPISREVCLRIRDLDFQGDPADELIAATSLAYRVPLLTRDARILSSHKVPLA